MRAHLSTGGVLESVDDFGFWLFSQSTIETTRSIKLGITQFFWKKKRKEWFNACTPSAVTFFTILFFSCIYRYLHITHQFPFDSIQKNKSISDKNNSGCFYWILCGNRSFPLNQIVYGLRRVQIASVPKRKKHMSRVAIKWMHILRKNMQNLKKNKLNEWKIHLT